MPNDITVARYVPPVSIPDLRALAEAIARSKLFGMQTVDQALVLMALSQAEGRHPVLAARDYDIIQGRPSKKAQAMLRDFLVSGGKVEWHDLTDDVADATFDHPAGGTVRIRWDMERARKAGLGSKDMWKKYPRQMLRSRCVSEGVATVCPMATSGLYVPEEVMDFDDAPKRGRTRRATDDQEGESAATIIEHAPAEPAGEVFDAETGEVFDAEAIKSHARAFAQQGWKALRGHLDALEDAAYDILRPLIGTKEQPGELRSIAREADEKRNPFGLPPVSEPQPDTPAGEAMPDLLGGESRPATGKYHVTMSRVPTDNEQNRLNDKIDGWLSDGVNPTLISADNAQNIERLRICDPSFHETLMRKLEAGNG